MPSTKPAPGSLSYRDRFRLWRNGMIGDPGFRRLSRRLPGLRRIANRRANGLFAITAGFANAQILLACVELDLFARLAPAPLGVAEIARQVALTPEATERLLRAAEGLDLVCTTGDGRWTLADHGAVVAASPGIAAMVRHHAMVYRDLADPVALLRDPPAETATSRFWSYVGGEPGAPDAAAYSELMRVSQDMVIAEVLDAYSMAGHARLIDIGGGDGAFIAAAGERWKDLELDLFDLPAVANRARDRLGRGILGPRLTIHGGSFFDDPIPGEPDCYALIRVLYDHDDEAALRILTNIRRAMDPGDTLIIGEPMAGDTPGGKLVAAYFTFYLLAMRSGRCRTPADIFALLRAAGFIRMRSHATTMPVVASLVSAQI
ncbi:MULTISPECIES: methyltransferase [unclassified Roseitalea]|uniref:methyltransferase n=1 Tax=unclassified Roseitalea TaxID=2639107 RepID=UPI00273D3125|nr:MULTISPECIES: methyltransferase [unclassified Roseitalea]